MCARKADLPEETRIVRPEMIFIVGASRSGTTMMSSILNQHQNVSISMETHYFDDLRQKLGKKPALTSEEQRRCENYFLALGHRAYNHHGDPEKSRYSRDELCTLANVIGCDADAYFEAFCRIDARLTGKQIWGEKTPRHVFRIPEILEKFPKGRVICMVRDPRAVIASYRDWTYRERGSNFEDDPERKLEIERADERARKSYNIILLSMLWRSTVSAAVAAQEQFGSQRVRIQQYEELVTSPELTVQNITSWLDIEYQAGMLEVPMKNSTFSQVQRSKGVSSEAVQRWRQKLSDAEVGLVQTCCGPMLLDAGYESEPVRTPYALLMWKWATLPLAGVQAAAANRERIASLPAYLWQRLQGLSPKS